MAHLLDPEYGYKGTPDQMAVSMFLDELYSASSDVLDAEILVYNVMDRFNTARGPAFQGYIGWLQSFPRGHLTRPGDLRAGTRKGRR